MDTSQEHCENDSSLFNTSKYSPRVKRNGSQRNVKVAVRIRPVEECHGTECCWKQEADMKTLCELRDSAESKQWRFDRVFGESTSTGLVYEETIKDLIDPVLQGVHGTALVYGQTSSGKTHTMFGSTERGSDRIGAAQLALKDTFSKIDKLSADRDFTLEISYVEVYNEIIGDLLLELDDGDASPERSRPVSPVLLQRVSGSSSTSSRSGSPFQSPNRTPYRSARSIPGGNTPSRSKPITIRENPDGEVSITSTKKRVNNVDEAVAILKDGAARRQVSRTGMNQRSSRSHTIFTLHITSVHNVTGEKLCSQLNLVDLAGSESTKTSNAVGNQVQEARNINQSLLSLALVISKLAAKSPSQSGNHVAFRNSKLTRILKPALCGDSLVSIICCITPAKTFIEETRNTLQFARTARKVKVNAKPKVVPKLSDGPETQKIIADLKKELERLQDIALEKESTAALVRLQMESDGKMKQLQEELQKKDEQITRLKSLLGSVLVDSQQDRLQSEFSLRPRTGTLDVGVSRDGSGIWGGVSREEKFGHRSQVESKEFWNDLRAKRTLPNHRCRHKAVTLLAAVAELVRAILIHFFSMLPFVSDKSKDRDAKVGQQGSGSATDTLMQVLMGKASVVVTRRQ